ncbi:MAG TPA: heme-binding protein, partial [Bryobacteraceae bacterium]
KAAAGDGMAIVVVDRPGNALAVYRRSQASDADVEKALSLARTGAFFSNQRTPLSSRTVRSISRSNFPEGIPNQPAGALFGIENTNRGCDFNVTFLPGQSVPRPLSATGMPYGTGIATVAGGLALFRNGETVVGGVGVAGLGSDDLDEYAAVSGSAGAGFFVHLPLPDPGAVYIDGFRLPFVSTGTPAGLRPGAADGAYQLTPVDGAPAPEGWLVGPTAGSKLSLGDIQGIVANAIETAKLTRAAIRLPVGSRASMVISVADLDGTILALYRMPDSTIFSIDVALTKARNVIYFSGAGRDPLDLPGVPIGTAVTNRTIGFGSQEFFPSGIFNSSPGPFRQMYLDDIAHPCTQGRQPANANQSGIVFFPGSSPLYRNGELIGGLGVSGDGVEQDDFVSAGGAQGFEAPPAIRADQVFLRGVRLPYFKFPRNPEQ